MALTNKCKCITCDLVIIQDDNSNIGLQTQVENHLIDNPTHEFTTTIILKP